MRGIKNLRLAICLLLVIIFCAIPLTSSASQGSTFADDHILIYLRPQGGTAGTAEIHVRKGESLPAITIPIRRGYDFKGYFTEASGQGEQYYDSEGKTNKSCEFSDTAALYAQWESKTYSITYENMEDSFFGTYKPENYKYSKSSVISDPTKDGYVFFGWRINNSKVASKGLTITAQNYAEPLTLAAVWNRASLVSVVDNATEQVEMSHEDLNKIFQRQVEDETKGVTAENLDSEEVMLTMTAANADDTAEGAEDILGIAKGEALKFYDFSVKKSVTKVNSSSVVTNLNELPNTIEVKISLSGSMEKRTGYRVYRYHNGQAEMIPFGPIEGDLFQVEEYFERITDTDGKDKLVIHTRRLSTYAVIGNSSHMTSVGMVEEDKAELDVQARVLVSGAGAIYHVDINWGPMLFEYATGNEWDPYEHRYTDVRFFNWSPGSYMGGNNKVSVSNHSNGDVIVSFFVINNVLDGVDMSMNALNADGGQKAENIFLSKVPAEYAPAPVVDGYLRLLGSPTDPDFYKDSGLEMNNGYYKVGNIAVTIAYAGGAITPKTK